MDLQAAGTTQRRCRLAPCVPSDKVRRAWRSPVEGAPAGHRDIHAMPCSAGASGVDEPGRNLKKGGSGAAGKGGWPSDRPKRGWGDSRTLAPRVCASQRTGSNPAATRLVGTGHREGPRSSEGGAQPTVTSMSWFGAQTARAQVGRISATQLKALISSDIWVVARVLQLRLRGEARDRVRHWRRPVRTEARP